MSNLENKLKKIIDIFNNVNTEVAFKDIKKLSSKYNENISVQNVLFQIAKKVGDIDTSIDALNKIVFIKKNDTSYLSQLYKLLLGKGLLDEALEKINSILDIDSKNYDALRDKSYIYLLKNDYIGAKKYIENILSLKEDDYFGYNIKGLIYLKNNFFNEAKNLFDLAIKINDRYVDSYNNLGSCLLELEKLDEAKKVFNSAYNIEKKNVSTLINLANVLSLQDNIKEAEKYYNEALNLDPNNPEILSNLAICYCRGSNEKEAKIYYNKALKLNPYDYKLMYAYCVLQLKLNNFNKSWELFDSRLLIEKNKEKLNNFNLVKNNLFNDLKIDPDDNLLVLREQGIGEEILFSSVYPEIISKFENLKIEADKRLVSIFNRSFGKNIFVEDGYFSKNSKVSDFNKIIYAGSMIKFFRKNIVDFKYGHYLTARKDIVKNYEEKLSAYKGKLKIGISWKSVVNIYGSLKSLSIKDFEPLFTKERIVINLQYGDIDSDKKYILNKNKHLEVFDELDLFNDIEECMGLLKNLDIFITVSNSTAHFAGALGIPTILICPKKSSTYYYWNTQSGSSIWYKNIKVLGIEKSINQTIDLINNILDRSNEFEFSN